MSDNSNQQCSDVNNMISEGSNIIEYATTGGSNTVNMISEGSKVFEEHDEEIIIEVPEYYDNNNVDYSKYINYDDYEFYKYIKVKCEYLVDGTLFCIDNEKNKVYFDFDLNHDEFYEDMYYDYMSDLIDSIPDKYEKIGYTTGLFTTGNYYVDEVKQTKTYIDFQYYDTSKFSSPNRPMNDICSIIRFAAKNEVYMCEDYIESDNMETLGVKDISLEEMSRVRKLLGY